MLVVSRDYEYYGGTIFSVSGLKVRYTKKELDSTTGNLASTVLATNSPATTGSSFSLTKIKRFL